MGLWVSNTKLTLGADITELWRHTDTRSQLWRWRSHQQASSALFGCLRIKTSKTVNVICTKEESNRSRKLKGILLFYQNTRQLLPLRMGNNLSVNKMNVWATAPLRVTFRATNPACWESEKGLLRRWRDFWCISGGPMSHNKRDKIMQITFLFSDGLPLHHPLLWLQCFEKIVLFLTACFYPASVGSHFVYRYKIINK